MQLENDARIENVSLTLGMNDSAVQRLLYKKRIGFALATCVKWIGAGYLEAAYGIMDVGNGNGRFCRFKNCRIS